MRATRLFAPFVALLVASSAFADGDPSTSNLTQVVAYEGALQLGGVPLEGDVSMTFSLYPDDASGTEPVWREVHAVDSLDCAGDCPVAMYTGRFSVLLGEYVDISTIIADGEDVFLGVEILTDDGWLALDGRQRITPAPFALWSTSASNLTVAGALVVGGDARVEQALAVGGGATVGDDLVVDGDTTVGEDLSVTRHAVVGGNITMGDRLEIDRSGDRASALELDDSDGELILGRDFTQAVASSNLRVSQDLHVEGDLQVDGDITSFEIGPLVRADTYTDNDEFLSRHGLGAVGRRICFLGGMRANDIGNDGDESECRVYHEDGTWFIEAEADGGGADTVCWARCLIW